MNNSDRRNFPHPLDPYKVVARSNPTISVSLFLLWYFHFGIGGTRSDTSSGLNPRDSNSYTVQHSPCRAYAPSTCTPGLLDSTLSMEYQLVSLQGDRESTHLHHFVRSAPDEKKHFKNVRFSEAGHQRLCFNPTYNGAG